MTEKIQLQLSQLARLSDEVYAEFEAITIDRLRAIQATALIDIASLPEQDREDAIADLKLQTELLISAELERLLAREVALAETEETIAEIITVSLLTAMLIAVGGVDRLRQSQGARDIVLDTRRLIQGQLRAIRRNADGIANGEFTEGQLRDLPRRRSLSIRSGFSSANIFERMVSAFHNEGQRHLTSAHPCDDCPLYERKDWVPISEIIPIGTFCVCAGNCKCRVLTRFNPRRALQDLVGGNLINRVQSRSRFLENAENAYLERHGWL